MNKAAIMTRLIILLLQLSAVIGKDRRTRYGCEETVLDIECDEGTNISLVRANYGRFSIGICNKEGNTNWSVNCMQPRTLRILKDRCGGRSTCSVPVNSSIFGDPCPGTHKYVEVHYVCQQPGQELQPEVTDRAGQPVTPKEKPPWLLDLTATTEVSWQAKHASKSTTASTTQLLTTVTTTRTSGSTASSSTHGHEMAFQEQESYDENGSNYERDSISEGEEDVEGGREADLSFTNEPSVLSCPPVFARGLQWNWTRPGETSSQPCPSSAKGWARWGCSLQGERLSRRGPDLSGCQSSFLLEVGLRLREKQESIMDVAADLVALLTEARGTLFGGDILSVIKYIRSMLLAFRKHLASVQNVNEQETMASNFFESVVQTCSLLLEEEQLQAWTDLETQDQLNNYQQISLTISKMLDSLHEAASIVGDTMEADLSIGNSAVASSANVVSAVRVLKAWEAGRQEFPPPGQSPGNYGGAHITVPVDTVQIISKDGISKLGFLVINGLDQILPPYKHQHAGTSSQFDANHHEKMKFLNSKIVSLANANNVKNRDKVAMAGSPIFQDVLHEQKIDTITPVVINFEHLLKGNNPNEERIGVSCATWNVLKADWLVGYDESGCYVATTNATHTTCSCRVLNPVAVLMDSNDSNPWDSLDDPLHGHLEDVDQSNLEEKEEILNLGTILGVSLGIIFAVFFAVLGLAIFQRKQYPDESSDHHVIDLKPGFKRLVEWGHLQSACLGFIMGNDRDAGVGGAQNGKDDPFYPELNSSPTSTTLSSGTPLASTTVSNYFLAAAAAECQQQGMDAKEGQQQSFKPGSSHPGHQQLRQNPYQIDATSIEPLKLAGLGAASQIVLNPMAYHHQQQIAQPVGIHPYGGGHHTPSSSAYQTIMGAQPNVLPANQLPQLPLGMAVDDQDKHYFRPVSPHGHIYMEIDPVYAHLDPNAAHQMVAGITPSAALSYYPMQPTVRLSKTSSNAQKQQMSALKQKKLKHASGGGGNISNPGQTGVQVSRYPGDISRHPSSATTVSMGGCGQFCDEDHRPLIRSSTMRRSAPQSSCRTFSSASTCQKSRPAQAMGSMAAHGVPASTSASSWHISGGGGGPINIATLGGGRPVISTLRYPTSSCVTTADDGNNAACFAADGALRSALTGAAFETPITIALTPPELESPDLDEHRKCMSSNGMASNPMHHHRSLQQLEEMERAVDRRSCPGWEEARTGNSAPADMGGVLAYKEDKHEKGNDASSSESEGVSF